jgi:DNA-binding NarL/FixJ family response regulator
MPNAPPIRVFLVDDVRELRTLLRLELEEDPRIEIVGEAADGREGVEGVAELQPDVVLLDLSMPNMDGLEAIPLMRERAPGARLVVLSGHQAGRISLEALSQGATRYVDKAADFETLRSAVHEVAGYEPPFTDERFHIVGEMCTAFANGRIDELLKRFHPEATWAPFAAFGRELRTREEFRAFIDETRSGGRMVDVRTYGVEAHPPGLVVLGTLEIRGQGGLSATEIYWVVCFHGEKIKHAAGFDRREEALQAVRMRCAA